MNNISEIYPYKDDLGKNLYRKRTVYTVTIEQDVLANNKEEAEQLFLDKGGINHAAIGSDITEENGGIETWMVDANYTDSDEVKYMGKVVYEDDEYAEEDGLVEIDPHADEVEIPGDVDTTLDMEIETERGR